MYNQQGCYKLASVRLLALIELPVIDFLRKLDFILDCY